ncbi:MAG: beta-ketoacyl-[acyl-carrier-protein] synthase family protein [Candidatus Omnitrophica bacterium]|nr:beta-ketoacyl-[acyl-carrier-protein] synthase family protein [Candidatus Omnitrophota bacterium]
MKNFETVITGIGVIAPNGIGKAEFWQALENGLNSSTQISFFNTDEFKVKSACEAKNFDPKEILGAKGLRNLDRSALFLISAAKLAIDDAKIEITDENTDKFGVCTGTTFPHLWSITEFDKEVFTEGIEFASPALFPSTVMNAASSQVSIRFNIQGFNATVSTGFCSGLAALKYSIDALKTNKAEIIFSAGVETLTSSLFMGLQKLGYMAGLNGKELSCPFDKKRNGPILGEAACVFSLEEKDRARERGANIYAKIKSVCNYFDASKMGTINPQGEGLEIAIIQAIKEAGIDIKDIDYISSCANSTQDLDKTEVKVLNKIFGKELRDIPVSSIKSMIGETFAASGALQVASCIGAMQRGIIPPTINYEEKDPECEINCVPNKGEKKDVKIALITSFGPGGYNSACILEKFTEN